MNHSPVRTDPPRNENVPAPAPVPDGEAFERPLRLLVADDHGIVRDMLRRLLSAEPDFEVAGEAGDGAQAVAMAAALSPDVVVMDLAMLGLDGAAAARRITSERAGVRVVVLSGFVKVTPLFGRIPQIF